MAFDGIVTKSIVTELNNIVGGKIDKIFEPNKNSLLLGIYKNGLNYMLLSCITANNCRIHLTTHQQKNPLVAPNFCMLLRKHLLGLKIKKIYTKDLERIVFIDLENNENPTKPIRKKLIIELMGKHSNIILTDENLIIIDSIRHTSIEEHSNRDIYPTSKYSFPTSSKYSFLELKNFEDFYSKVEPHLTDYLAVQIEDMDNINISNFNIDKIIANTFNGISSSFVKNLQKELINVPLSKEALHCLFNRINDIILSNNLDIEFSNDKKDYYLIKSLAQKHSSFYINYILDDFYFQKETSELFKNYRNSMLNLILGLLKKYEKRLFNIDSKLLECKNMNIYRLYGELITSNLYKIPNYNMESIKLENYYDNNKEIEIPLDKKYLPSYNAKRYFKKYSKLKNALQVVTAQKKETIEDINYIESVIYEIESATSISDMDEIYDEISQNSIFEPILKKEKTKKNKTNKKKQLTTNKLTNFNPLKFIIDGYTILVGRNNKENDYLTCKFAKKNDIWFHTKDIHGSHVILKVDENKIIPEEILYEAAKLAAKHSKAKNSSHVPVDYCKVAFVKKPSGSKPGFVIYSNNKTLYI